MLRKEIKATYQYNLGYELEDKLPIFWGGKISSGVRKNNSQQKKELPIEGDRFSTWGQKRFGEVFTVS